MTRLAALVLGVATSTAFAAPRPRLLAVPSKFPPRSSQATLSNAVLFLNRCVGSCMLIPGAPDPKTDQTDLITAPVTFTEFAWQPGEWEGVVQCIKEVYSPYNVQVTDVRPAAAADYNETIVAGSATQIGVTTTGGLGGLVCGLGDLAQGCAPSSSGVSLAFTDGPNPGDCVTTYGTLDTSAILGMCWVVAQESAHNFGLDNEVTFLDGTSACRDPMSYQDDCGGEKFFRDEFAHCSANVTGALKDFCGSANECGSSQSSHQKLLAALGPGTPITTPPVVAITLPPAGTTVVAGVTVHAMASAQRGIATTELWLNGFKWTSTPGAAFGADGQPASDYQLTFPAGVPDSVIDIVVKAYDDLQVETDSATVTVTKGKAGGCDASKVNADGSFDTCAVGQKCQPGGKCAWDAPAGQLGDSCGFPQFCVSGLCEGMVSQQICTEACLVNSAASCPTDFECAMTTGNDGFCFPTGGGGGGGGCCSVDHTDTGALVAQSGLALGALALVFRRRRRPAQ